MAEKGVLRTEGKKEVTNEYPRKLKDKKYGRNGLVCGANHSDMRCAVCSGRLEGS